MRNGKYIRVYIVCVCVCVCVGMGHGWMDGRTNGRTDVRMYVRTYVCIYMYVSHRTNLLSMVSTHFLVRGLGCHTRTEPSKLAEYSTPLCTTRHSTSFWTKTVLQ